MPTQIHPVLVSRNSKTGPIPVSFTEAKTCPDTCPFKGHGCYAETGHTGMNWRKVSSGERGRDVEQFAKWVAHLPKGQFWRHNVAGDLPGDGNRIDETELAQLVMANRGKRGFTYTHYEVEGPQHAQNLEAVRKANAKGFTVNLSANDIDHADDLAKLDVAPVVTVLPMDTERGKAEGLDEYRKRVADLKTPEGRKVVVCPATYSETNCANCQLCQRTKGRAIVGFPAHGVSKKKASAIASRTVTRRKEVA